MRDDRARGTCLGKIDEVCPQSRRGSYIHRIASLTPRWRDGRFRLSIPTVSVRVSLPLSSRNRIPVEYMTLYSSIPRQPSTPPLLPTRFPRKPHQPPSRRIHLHLSLFPAATPTDFSEKSEMPVRDVLIHGAYWIPCMSFAILSVSWFLSKWKFLTLRDWLS